MGDQRFGFEFEWLEPALADDPRYQSADLFVNIAKDVARMAVGALPESYRYGDIANKKISDEELDEAFSSEDSDRYAEVLLVASIQEMLRAIRHDLIKPDSSWEQMFLARTMCSKGSGEGPTDFTREYFQKHGRNGGKKAAEIQADFRKKLCQTINEYLVTKHIWNDPDSKGNIKDISPQIWSEIEEATESDTDWNGYTTHDITGVRLGRRTVDLCVSNSKRLNL